MLQQQSLTKKQLKKQKIRNFAIHRIQRRNQLKAIREGKISFANLPKGSLFYPSSSESSSSSASSESTAFWESLKPPPKPVHIPVEVIDIDLVFPVPAFIYVKPRQILPKRVRPSIVLKWPPIVEHI